MTQQTIRVDVVIFPYCVTHKDKMGKNSKGYFYCGDAAFDHEASKKHCVISIAQMVKEVKEI